MDLSSLPEDQRQQLQKIQQLFHEHQQQQQQQQEQQQQEAAASSQAYDPTQVQPYDQSYYAYYQQYHHDPNQSQPYPQQQHHQDQSQQQQNHHYDYYQANHSNAYQQQQAYAESAPAPAPTETNPPPIASSRALAPAADVAGQGQDAYYPQQPQAGENLGFSVPAGLNPAAAAAVAALSQLTQFAGTMEAAERAIALVRGGGGGGGGFGPGHFVGPGPTHHGPGPFHMSPAGQSVYRGGGRRGRAFRGGNFGNRPPRSSGMGPALRSRGRGRGRGGLMRFPPNDASSSSRPKPSAAGVAELNEGGAVTEPTADNHEETEQQKPGSGAPIKRAWCELCRVDCTSLEILEQHKNGKKHKKNLQRMEELPNAIKPVTKIQDEQKSVAESNPEIVLEGEDKKLTLPENLTTEALATDNKEGMERQNDVVEQRRGLKRMMRGGRGGKRLRTDGPRRPMEPPKQPKVVIPLICDLCNVKCDTQEVFDRHLAGKKHISKLKRFEGHQALYGPEGLQALYPPNPLSQTLLHHQGPQQAFYGPQVSYPPPGPCVPPTQGHHQGPETSSYYDGQMATPVIQQQPDAFGTESNQNGASGSEAIGLAQQVIK